MLISSKRWTLFKLDSQALPVSSCSKPKHYGKLKSAGAQFISTWSGVKVRPTIADPCHTLTVRHRSRNYA